MDTTITALTNQNITSMQTLVQEGELTLDQIGQLDQTITGLLETVIVKEEQTLASFSSLSQRITETEEAIEAIVEEARTDLTEIQEKTRNLEQQFDEFNHDVQAQLGTLRESIQEFLDEVEDKVITVEENLSSITQQANDFASEVENLEDSTVQEIQSLYTLVETTRNEFGEREGELTADLDELDSKIRNDTEANLQSLQNFIHDSTQNLEQVSQEELQPAFEESMTLMWTKLVREALASAEVAANQAKCGLLIVGEKGLEIKEDTDEDFEEILNTIKEGVLDDLSDAQENLKQVETHI
jgi:hypothetical protein